MAWFEPGDDSREVIRAADYIGLMSARRGISPPKMARNLLIVETGNVLNHISEVYKGQYSLDPQRLYSSLGSFRVSHIAGEVEVSIIEKAVGAPVAVAALEAAITLGARRLFVLGICGGFSPDSKIGDIVIPSEVVREEGTSFHYMEAGRNAVPDQRMHDYLLDFLRAQQGLKLHVGRTLSTDAIFRETLRKERSWRDQGIIGIEMEMSALFAAAEYRKIPAVGMLVVSDLHVLEDEPRWTLGSEDLRLAKHLAGELIMDFARGFSA